MSRVVTCYPVYYVSGPMRGYPEFNHPAFDRATEELRRFGVKVFSPAESDRESGFDATGMTGDECDGFDLRSALARDVEFICLHATHMHMLPGWSKSLGANAERALGIALDLTIDGATE